MQDFYDEQEILKNDKLSPMMREYLETQQKYQDCIILWRCGDFYEAYSNNAITLNKEFGLKASDKSCGLKEPLPMCGFPIRAASIHFNRFLQSNYKIAVVEQTEDPKNVKGRLVNRDVVRILTPGTVIDEDMLVTYNNYLVSVVLENNVIGFSYVDISTGETYASTFDANTLKEEIARIQPKEVICNDKLLLAFLTPLAANYNFYIDKNFNEIDENILKKYFSVSYLKDLSLPIQAIHSLQKLLSYVQYTQKKIAVNIDKIKVYDVTETMLMDGFTRESLELTQRLRTKEKKGSLYDILDYTKTAMGSRKLRQRIEQPYLDKKLIEKQLNIVEELVNDMVLTNELRKLLNSVYDIERICGRLAFERILPKEMIQLKLSLENLPEIKSKIENTNYSCLKDFIQNMDTLYELYQLIDKAIMDEPKNIITEGCIIKTGYNEYVDKYRDTLDHIYDKLNSIRETEKSKWGNTVKIVQNDIDGYYMEITKKALQEVVLPSEYVKIKDLTNGSRFVFPELKNIQNDYLEALSKNNAIENELFNQVRTKLTNHMSQLKETAVKIAELDVLLSMALTASLHNYVKPQLNEEHKMSIVDGRHPVIEQMTKNTFICNDFFMDKEHFIYLITGPNMSGKSTYMRQIALITLMAQIGSFVPAKSANISLCDRIFTRIGASDNLSEGESTFMVEMNELSQILNSATDKSMCLLDEIGRGTSMFDGISIAKASIQYIAEKIKCFTLFSTHYFDLIDMEEKYDSIQNYKVDVSENKGAVEFLRKVIPGSSTKSYGIHVAEMAGMPIEVITNAQEILSTLESKKSKEMNHVNICKKGIEVKTQKKEKKITNSYLPNKLIIKIQQETDIEKLMKLDLECMSPKQVYDIIYEMQRNYKC